MVLYCMWKIRQVGDSDVEFFIVGGRQRWATMIVAVSSNWGSGCTAPVTAFMLVVTTIAFTVVVC